jgi:rhodanese-related sulfurtransferase
MSPPAEEITAARAQEMLAGGAALVDVREPYERDAGHIAGSAHIDLASLPRRAEEIDRDRPVIFYCRAGVRSAMAADAYAAAGYTAYSMAGGLVAWVSAGLPIVPDDGRVAAH